MAPEEVEKPIDMQPEETKAEPTATSVQPAEEVHSAPPTPPADPMKQMGDAATQVGASVDKAFAGQTAQNRFIIILVVSLFSGGVGDILNGQVMKGAVILVIALCLFIFGFLIPLLFLLTLPLLGLVHVAAAIDAIAIGYRISKGEKFGDWDFFWKPAPKTI